MSGTRDRALDALDAAVGRVRSAGDAADRLPHAGTAVLLRDAAAGPEVLMIERPERGSFAGAWVFPGGRVEDADVADSDLATARRAAARETLEEVGLAVGADDLVAFSRWEPPPGIAKRILTWFFVGRAPDGIVEPSADEVVAVQWVKPAQILDAHARGALTLYPPTWVTLWGLRAHGTVGAALAAAQAGGVRGFESLVRRGAAGPVFVWAPDVAHDPGVDLSAAGARHRLVTGALPWRYVMTGDGAG